MKRVVLDTNVLVTALRSSDGASNHLLRAVAQRRIIALSSTALFLEYEAVLRRPEQRLAHGLDFEEIEHALSQLAALCVPVDLEFAWRPQLPDPDDELVLAAAVNGRADVIATFNTKDFELGARRFGVRTMTPGQILKGMLQ
jgi:putative PIN family toxin of toxin-antitoxin system